MKTIRFVDDDIYTLAEICSLAADRYRENAAEFDKLAAIKTGPIGAMYPTGAAAQELADQFRKQERDARKYSNIFQACEPFNVEHDDGPDPDAD